MKKLTIEIEAVEAEDGHVDISIASHGDATRLTTVNIVLQLGYVLGIPKAAWPMIMVAAGRGDRLIGGSLQQEIHMGGVREQDPSPDCGLVRDDKEEA